MKMTVRSENSITNRRREWMSAKNDPTTAARFLSGLAASEREWIASGHSDGNYARSLIGSAMRDAGTELRALLMECARSLPEGSGFPDEDYPVYWDIGEHICFGNFAQSAHSEQAPVEWTVLDADGDTRLLIASCAIDCVPYHNRCAGTTWKECGLRQWLNDYFYESAFSSYEKTRIKETQTHTPDNPEYGTPGGGDCTDRVTILSVPEVTDTRYFETDAERACRATPYAQLRGAYTAADHSCRQWLRTPGDHSDYAACVNITGSVSMSGNGVNCADHAVRPVIRVYLP